ncbi:aminodeoxychorismate synthase component I [Rhodospirillum sp. A1_3_36]|uniref:aminodeoxychorismate synthase component I n=1 Tax=Rhodospirillum sp. A1_3_36 TaxID=3391666 RepID=UPI0039A5A43E
MGLGSKEAPGSVFPCRIPTLRPKYQAPFPEIGAPVIHIEPIPFRDPLDLLPLAAQAEHAVLFDSAARDGGRGRYAFLCVDPWRVITADGQGTWVDGLPAHVDPFTALRVGLEAMAEAVPETCPLPFPTGAAGLLGYELGRHLEHLPNPAPNHLNMPELAMGLYDTVVGLDLEARRAWILAGRRRRPDARERTETLAARIAALPSATAPDWSPLGHWTPDRPRAAVEDAIARTIAYIHAGDIFQANITQRFLGQMPRGLDDMTLYKRLRQLSPAPFAAFLRLGRDRAVISASPERFLSLEADGRVETRPIKGTRPRGITAEDDARLARELLASEKDRAENLMIVDLMRNDLGRVCTLGSIAVPQSRGLETFASVHHLVSAVVGKLRPGAGPVELLKACFPGGSITGAPKIRAMEIISELERVRRDAYCGSIAWIGLDGSMDSNIVIRSLTRSGETLVAQAGGGIVADSDPAAEYEESLVKLAPLLTTLTGPAP